MENEFLMLIDGEWVRAESNQTFKVINPATCETITHVPNGDKEDARKALEAAKKACPDWSGSLPIQRASLMRKASALVREREKEISRVLTQEQGKPLGEARGEVSSSAETIEYYAEEARRILGEVIPSDSAKIRSFVIKQPIGVVATISAWNYPVKLLSWKIAPALIAGCTIVAKPASYTPLSVIEFFRCFVDAGIPPGVVNLVTGSGTTVGRELVENPIVKKVAFTGETGTGKEIIRRSAQGLKKVSLELGGNCPFIVCDDADVEMAAKEGVYRAFRNMGQVCNSINRIYVHRKIADQFIEKFVERTRELHVANGLEEPDADLGPMISDEQRKHVKEHIQDALEKGAEILHGGKEPEGGKFSQGFFFQPTVLINVDHTMRIMKEETFGPVAPIMVVSDIDEAVKLANDTRYGLVSYVYTKDLKRATLIAESLECGTVGINDVSGGEISSPYGGWKESGLGLELSHYGLEEYLQVKQIRIGIGY